MSELAQAAGQEEAVTAGALLRRAREASGLHVAALAVSLKVPVRKLEALEDDRYQELGDAVFIRALASSVCRTLKADPRPILDRLPQTAAPRLVRDNDGLNAPFRAPGDGPAPSWIDRVKQPVPAFVLLLVVGIVVISLLPVARHEEKATAATAPEAAPAAATAFPPAADPASAVPALAAASEPAAEAVAPAPAVVAAAAPAAVPDAPQASMQVPGTAPANGIVVFRTRGDSWVEVVDAKGVVALRKLMGAGESTGASGALPLTVTIGKVDMTDVEVRGKKFDMRPVSKDNVARFEVK